MLSRGGDLEDSASMPWRDSHCAQEIVLSTGTGIAVSALQGEKHFRAHFLSAQYVCASAAAVKGLTREFKTTVLLQSRWAGHVHHG